MSTTHVLVLSLALFTLGVVGMAVRRNFITVLMCVELILNAANLRLKQTVNLDQVNVMEG
ncbi:MAG: hypothetical protein B7Z68_09155 [Acidobacteria bacterium 21-70-11]|nr:MAG: hypothetical protein B7Z68_09155 [Acidobacteria bacterium 21-70-11]